MKHPWNWEGERKVGMPGSFPIGDPSVRKQIKGNDAFPFAKRTSTSDLNNRICKQCKFYYAKKFYDIYVRIPKGMAT